MNRRSLIAACLGLAVLAPTLHPSAAAAALFVPTKTADGADGACDADCSLREAVIAANASPGEDVILLAPGTYLLGRAGTDDAALDGDLDLLDDLILAGEGAGQSIVNGGALDRVIQVFPGVTAEVRDVTLANGRVTGAAGGAIDNAGQLTLRRVVVSGSISLAGGGTAARGGAIHTSGSGSRLEVIDGALVANQAEGGNGGALLAGGELLLANVTVSGNRATGSGGGLYTLASSTVTVNNATFSGNVANGSGGGLFAESAAFIGTAPVVTNSLLAGNDAGTHDDCSGPIGSSYNLIGDGTGCVGPSAANHDQVGTTAAPIDPVLGPVVENGGPTPTHALFAGSPAIDAGNPAEPGSGGTACAATDQRGAARPGGPLCDVGAFELTTECVPGGVALCLGGGRFKVTAMFQTQAGFSGLARAVTLTRDSGYFWFFDPANVEVTVKALNGCGFNNRHWVFAAGMTNVEVHLFVTDVTTGAVKSYTNPLNRTFRTILDTNAFATCP